MAKRERRRRIERWEFRIQFPKYTSMATVSIRRKYIPRLKVSSHFTIRPLGNVSARADTAASNYLTASEDGEKQWR